MTGRRRGRAARAGFTLVEVLAAFAVLAAFMAVIGRALVVARTGTEASVGYAGAEAVARTLLEGPVPLAIRQPGQLAGKLDGHAFLMVTQPIDIPVPPPEPGEPPRQPPAFVPLRLTVSVQAGAERMVKAQTVRLVPREGQP